MSITPFCILGMSEAMSERVTHIAGLTVMNDDSKQAIFYDTDEGYFAENDGWMQIGFPRRRWKSRIGHCYTVATDVAMPEGNHKKWWIIADAE